MGSTMIARPEAIWSYQFRVVLLGDSTVGKTALLQRFTDGSFLEVSDPTVGVDFYSRLVQVGPSTRIKLQLWDTAGQERFRSITRSYYHNSIGAILVYDVTNRDSFLHLSQWAEEARLHVAPRSIYFILVGQKCDLEIKRKVTYEEACVFAKLQRMPYIETSAKRGINVLNAFLMLAENILSLIKTGQITPKDGWDGVKCGLVPSSPPQQLDNEKRCTKNGCC